MTSFESVIDLDPEYVRDRKNNFRINETKVLAGLILYQAIRDIQRKNKQITTQHDKDDAIEWLKSDKDNYIFDFINICCLFDIDPELTRIQITKGIKLPNLNPKKKVREEKECLTGTSFQI